MRKSRLMIVYLASGSPRRRLLLSLLGVDVVCVPPNVREVEARKNELSAIEVACGNALKKLEAAKKLYPGKVILAADTVVTCQGKIYGKPRDREEAALFLRELRGRLHEVVTSVAVVSVEGEVRCGYERSGVRFKSITNAEIEWYLERVYTLDKAGGYSLQEGTDCLVAEVVGSVSNIIGLPLGLAAAWVRWAHDSARTGLNHLPNPRRIGEARSTRERRVGRREGRVGG